MAANELKPGQIITFYSYKGGTGRSMAVANCACWLARNFPALPRRVLVMDWDLEAPGLHRYFAETAERTENRERPGVINYFDAIQSRLRDEPQLCERLEDAEGWRVLREEFPLDKYLIPDLVAGVDLVKAGKYDEGYAELISTFNWVDFYRNYGVVFPAFRDYLQHAYDFCLIDSRTGFNDVSGICTMLLPEKLVAVFTPNRQNVAGVVDLAARAAAYRIGSTDPRTLSVFPLPSRIENAEHELRQVWQKQYQQDFETTFRSIYKLDSCDLAQYFDDVQLPHVSFYSYGEEIALLKEERSSALSLSRAYDLFFHKLLELDFAWDKKESPSIMFVPAETEIVRHVPRLSATGPYDIDIFISYSHVDNMSVVSEEGWITKFQRILETRLTQLFGERLKLWRDTKLSGADFFDDLVAHRLSITNIFVAVITPAYIKSEWCMRELTEFYRQTQKEDEVVVGGQSRIVKVVKTPTEYEGFGQSEVHQLLASIPSFQFYEIRADGRPREFTPDTSRGDQRFWQRLDDLAYDIVELLKKQRRAAEGVPLRDESPAGADVYLAETGLDLDFQRDGIRQELQQRGYQVVPHGRLPREVNALREVVSAYLERCRLSVHLIGDSYGPILEGDNCSTVETQNELAAERSERAGFSRVIWMPVGLNPHDVRQQQFVEGLRRDVHAQRGADLLESSLESLKTFLHEKLTSRPGNVSRMVRGKTIRIYVIFDQRDLENVKRIEDYLFGLGFEVIIPPFEGDGAEIAQLHRENLMLSDAALIYYGQGSDLWLRSKLTDLRKALGWGRAEPMLAQAVVIGPPETAEKRNFRSHESIVILDFGDFTPKSLQPLVEAIQAKS